MQRMANRSSQRGRRKNQGQWSSVAGLQHSFPPFSAKSALTFLWGIHSSHIPNPVVWILGQRRWLVLPNSLPTASHLFSIPTTLIFFEGFFVLFFLNPCSLTLESLSLWTAFFPHSPSLHPLSINLPSGFIPLLKPFLTFQIRPGHSFMCSFIHSFIHLYY